MISRNHKVLKNDSHIIGAVTSAIVMLLIFLLLWLINIDKPQNDEEEGIELLALGDMDEEKLIAHAGAQPAAPAEAPTPAPTPTPAPQVTPTPAPTPTPPQSSSVIASQEEQALKAAEARRQDSIKQARLEQQLAAERARKEAEAKAAAEKAAAEKAAAEAAAKAAAEKAAKDKAAGLIGGAGFGSGSGNGTGTGNAQSGSGSNDKGNPASGVGSGTSGGHGWSLAGRSVKGTIPNTTDNCINESGTVVVRIRVNAAGDVIEATRGQGTNTSSDCLLEAAIRAAKQAKFSTGSGDVVGSITYVFKLK